jgi:hypothetical protein
VTAREVDSTRMPLQLHERQLRHFRRADRQQKWPVVRTSLHSKVLVRLLLPVSLSLRLSHSGRTKAHTLTNPSFFRFLCPVRSRVDALSVESWLVVPISNTFSITCSRYTLDLWICCRMNGSSRRVTLHLDRP